MNKVLQKLIEEAADAYSQGKPYSYEQGFLQGCEWLLKNPWISVEEGLLAEEKDLCKTCKYYWQDFPMPLDYTVSHCEILDRQPGIKEMDRVVPYPCIKCPFDSYSEKPIK